MVKKDLSGRITERAARQLARAQARVNQLIPLGPNRAEATPQELRRRYERGTPQERMALAASMGGIDNALDILNGDSTQASA